MHNPLFFQWQGNCFTPIPRHAKECDGRYVIGEHYALEEIQERSAKSHRQYFAALREAWLNLSEAASIEFPTPKHLRKHALIRSGYFDKRSIVARSNAEALRIAAFIRPLDEYAIVTVNGCVVEVYTAKSQSHRAMPKGEFQASKTAVLDWVAHLVGTSPTTLREKANLT